MKRLNKVVSCLLQEIVESTVSEVEVMHHSQEYSICDGLTESRPSGDCSICIRWRPNVNKDSVVEKYLVDNSMEDSK